MRRGVRQIKLTHYLNLKLDHYPPRAAIEVQRNPFVRQPIRLAVLIVGVTVVGNQPAWSQPAAQEPVSFRDDIVQSVINGDKTQRRDVSLSLTADAVVVTPRKGGAITIPYASITGMTYDRRSKIRKMAYTLGKAQDHFLTVQYKAASGVGEFVEIEMGKNVAPRLIATLEARSGKKIDRVVGS